jgi:hypothetical protein
MCSSLAIGLLMLLCGTPCCVCMVDDVMSVTDIYESPQACLLTEAPSRPRYRYRRDVIYTRRGDWINTICRLAC